MLAGLKARARRLKNEVTALWFASLHPHTPGYAKLLLYAILAYALSPIDLIPDFIPVLGLLDELVLLPLAIGLALKLIPHAVMTECRMRAQTAAAGSSLAGRIGAAAILILWLALIALAAGWGLHAIEGAADR